jgi:hypothetical protein
VIAAKRENVPLSSDRIPAVIGICSSGTEEDELAGTQYQDPQPSTLKLKIRRL